VRVVAATLLTLAGAVLLQLVVFSHQGHVALSDIPRVFLHRGIGPTTPPYLSRPFEYPVLSGALMYLAALVWPTALGVLLVTAVAASGCVVAVTVLLARRFGTRVWRWAIALPVLLYAFQNWDLFAITALVVGLLAFERGADRRAGVAFGIGAAIKLFPIVVVPALAMLRWRQGHHDAARRLVVSSITTLALLNLAGAVLGPRRWWWTYAFQSHRQATWGSAWFYLFRVLGFPTAGSDGLRLANTVSAFVLVAGIAWLALRVRHHPIDAYAAAAASVAIFVLANKVYSPTYDVWLVAFFVMVPYCRKLWLAFCGVDLAVFVTVYGYFHGTHSAHVVHLVLPVLVAVRTVILLVMVTDAVRERPLRRSPVATVHRVPHQVVSARSRSGSPAPPTQAT
jgi:uncharacterized membrane protein